MTTELTRPLPRMPGPAVARHQPARPAARRDAREIARAVRRHVVRMAGTPSGAHAGGSLSCADILAVLHADVMRAGDRFLLSKGHAAPALYGLLAELGRIDPGELDGYAQPGSRLFGHPHAGVPGVEFPTGSLGHGLGLAVGLALGERMRGRTGRTFVLMGDGELQEGSVWESAMYAGHLRLANLVAVIDRNGLQLTGRTEDRVGLEPLPERFAAFGWQPRPVDGHDLDALRHALTTPADRPVAVVARTVKGRGVPFLEAKTSSHYVTLRPPLLKRALAALERSAG